MIGFAGLTHLGVVSAIATASKGFAVLGYDSDPVRIAEINAGRLPVTEPGLDDLAQASAQRLSYSCEIADLGKCDVVYIATDVPTDDGGRSDLTSILTLIERVLPVLRMDATLVVLCQVPPGFTRKITHDPRRLYYQVETLVFGRAVERATRPERTIVGCADPKAPLPAPYASLLAAFGCPLLPMRYESAELTKIAINVFLAASVTAANTLAEVAEHIGADWSEITPALRLDRRIGEYSYLSPGLGLAGGNIERDLGTVLRLSELVGSEASVVAAFLANSRHARDWALRVVHREVLSKVKEASLGVLGLAYKENTHSTKNSPSLALLSHLRHLPVSIYDPVVPAAAAGHPEFDAASSAIEAAQGKDALLIMTPWPEFRALEASALAAAMRGRVIIDPYGVLPPPVGFEYFRIGSHA